MQDNTNSTRPAVDQVEISSIAAPVPEVFAIRETSHVSFSSDVLPSTGGCSSTAVPTDIFNSINSTGSARSDYTYNEESDDDESRKYKRCKIFDSVGSTPSAIVDGGYHFRSMHKVKRDMEFKIRSLTEVLNIPAEIALVLLRNYKCDQDRLTEDFCSDRKETILAACGVLQRYTFHQTKQQDSTHNDAPLTGTCPICLEDEVELLGMSCGHAFCKPCWENFIRVALEEGPPCVYTKCPYPKCTELVTAVEVAQHTPPHALQKYQEYQLRSYVERSWNMRWCPGASCEQAAVGSSSSGLIGEGKCSCGTQFCLQCGEPGHIPATCAMMSAWNEKVTEGSEGDTENWLLAKTKKCPNCKTRIQKNGGCSHMQCSQCEHHFCWLCMQDWKVHGYERACNAFELEQAAKNEDPRARLAEEEIRRFEHAVERYQNHWQGEDFASRALAQFVMTTKGDSGQDSYNNWLSFEKALTQLVECRRVLKLTYVVVFSLRDSPATRRLLEQLQQDLERYTEQLSEHTEKQYAEVDRAAILNLTSAVEKYAQNVMQFDLESVVS